MIDFSGYYYIQETDIVAIERKNSANEDYPFKALVRTRNGLTYSVNYTTEDERNKVVADMARKVEYATQDKVMEKVLGELYQVKYTVSCLDKRQLKIWRQLKELLGLKGGEDTLCSGS